MYCVVISKCKPTAAKRASTLQQEKSKQTADGKEQGNRSMEKSKQTAAFMGKKRAS
jgi:hypothetical protein